MSEYAAPYRSDDRRVEGPAGSGTFTIDDGQVDHVRVRDPETGMWSERSIKATDEEIWQRDLDSLRRSLAGIPLRLAAVGEHFPYERPPSSELIEERREGLIRESEHIAERIVELEALLERAPDPVTSKKRR